MMSGGVRCGRRTSVTQHRTAGGCARRGDMDACAAIYRRYGTACYNLALRILGERAAAEDVVQEVFLKMMNTLSGFRGDAPFGVWLKRMTANASSKPSKLPLVLTVPATKILPSPWMATQCNP